MNPDCDCSRDTYTTNTVRSAARKPSLLQPTGEYYSRLLLASQMNAIGNLKNKYSHINFNRVKYFRTCSMLNVHNSIRLSGDAFFSGASTLPTNLT